MVRLETASTNNGGDGGDGLASTITGSVQSQELVVEEVELCEAISGHHDRIASSGGAGGGGNGGTDNAMLATSGTANTGGGGGGGGLRSNGATGDARC